MLYSILLASFPSQPQLCIVGFGGLFSGCFNAPYLLVVRLLYIFLAGLSLIFLLFSSLLKCSWPLEVAPCLLMAFAPETSTNRPPPRIAGPATGCD